MRVLVAGGTGFVGRAVVERLLESGSHDVAVTTREPGGRTRWGRRVERVQAFAGDHVSLGKAFTRAEVVVLCIQFPNHPVENPALGHTYLEVDGHGTEVAAQVARRVGVRRVVYVSGAGAGQGRPQAWYRAKDLAEAALQASGLETVVLRPSWIYGPGDRSMSRFITLCRRLPLVPVIGDGRNHVDPLYVGDAARCIVDSALRPDAAFRTFDLGGPQRLTTDEILREIQRLIGRHRPLLHHPAALMKLLTWPLQFLPEPFLTPRAIDFILQEVDLDTGPAQRFFGFEWTPLAAGLQRCLRAS